MKNLEESRKIIRGIDSPLNNIFIDISNTLDPIVNALNITPNMLTLASFFSQLFGIRQLNEGKWENSLLFLFIGLILDAYDGDYARRNNMVTGFGERLDSATDLMTFIILMYVMFDKYSTKKCSVLVSFVALLFVFSKFYSGCRDKYVGKESDSIVINQFKGMCSNMEGEELEQFVINYKWFSTCHIYLLALVVIFLFENKVIS